MSAESHAKLYLASASPRRKELLRQLGVNFIQVTQDYDETPRDGEKPLELVERLARGKADSAAKLLREKKYPLLTADTLVVLNGQSLGKPENLDDAARMLQILSGQTHQVHTSVCLGYKNKLTQVTVTSHVTFENLSEQQITAYCRTQEPLGKAGSYAIQGVAASFIARLEGSYTAVVGLPLHETRQLLDKFRIKYLLS